MAVPQCFLWSTLIADIIRAVSEDGHQEIDDFAKAGSTEGTRTLLALALTCKAFSEPALRKLWTQQVNLDNFARVVPMAPQHPGSGQRSIWKDSWTRFDFYARFLETLVLDDERFDQAGLSPSFISRDALRLISHHPKSFEAVFPRLQMVICRTIRPFSIAWLPSILGSSLTGLTVSKLAYLREDTSLRDPFLISQPGQDPSSNPFVAALSSAAHHLHMVDLRGCETPETIFRMLASFPSLSCLKLALHEWDTWKNYRAPGGGVRFPCLRTLVLQSPYGADLCQCTNFLKAQFARAAVESLEIVGFKVEQPAELRGLFTVLAINPKRPATLTSFRLNVKMNHGRTQTTMHELRPLLELHELKELTLDLTPRYQDAICLKDADLKACAMAWPKIQHLHLRSYPPQRTDMPSILSLIILGRYCRDLRELTLTFDASEAALVALNARKVPRRAVQQRLLRLNPRNSPVGDSRTVAQFLRTLFPALDGIVGIFDEHDPTMYAIVWRRVQAALDDAESVQGNTGMETEEDWVENIRVDLEDRESKLLVLAEVSLPVRIQPRSSWRDSIVLGALVLVAPFLALFLYSSHGL